MRLPNWMSARLCKKFFSNWRNLYHDRDCVHDYISTALNHCHHKVRTDLDYSTVDILRICHAYCAPGGFCTYGEKCDYIHPRNISQLRTEIKDHVSSSMALFLYKNVVDICMEYYCGQTFINQVALIALPYHSLVGNIKDKELICPLWLENKCVMYGECGMVHGDEKHHREWQDRLNSDTFHIEFYKRSPACMRMMTKRTAHKHSHTIRNPQKIDRDLSHLFENFANDIDRRKIYSDVSDKGAKDIYGRMVESLNQISEEYSDNYMELDRKRSRVALTEWKNRNIKNSDRLDRSFDRSSRR